MLLLTVECVLYMRAQRLWAAARIDGYLDPQNAKYMGPADQWDAEQQWMFDRVAEALVVHHLHT